MSSDFDIVLTSIPDLKEMELMPRFDYEYPSKNQMKLLAHIISNNFNAIADLLKKNEVDVDYYYEVPYKKTTLEIACVEQSCQKRVECVALLIQYGANVENALSAGAQGGNPTILQLLLDHLEMNKVNLYEKKTIIDLTEYVHRFSKNEEDFIEVLKLVISSGININATDPNGFTAVFLSAKYKFRKFIEVFLTCPNINLDITTENMRRTAREIIIRDNLYADILPYNCKQQYLSDRCILNQYLHQRRQSKFIQNYAEMKDTLIRRSSFDLRYSYFCEACELGLDFVVKYLLCDGVDLTLGTGVSITEPGVSFSLSDIIYDEVSVRPDTRDGENSRKSHDKSESPFYLACLNGHYKVVQILLDYVDEETVNFTFVQLLALRKIGDSSTEQEESTYGGSSRNGGVTGRGVWRGNEGSSGKRWAADYGRASEDREINEGASEKTEVFGKGVTWKREEVENIWTSESGKISGNGRAKNGGVSGSGKALPKGGMLESREISDYEEALENVETLKSGEASKRAEAKNTEVSRNRKSLEKGGMLGNREISDNGEALENVETLESEKVFRSGETSRKDESSRGENVDTEGVLENRETLENERVFGSAKSSGNGEIKNIEGLTEGELRGTDVLENGEEAQKSRNEKIFSDEASEYFSENLKTTNSKSSLNAETARIKTEKTLLNEETSENRRDSTNRGTLKNEELFQTRGASRSKDPSRNEPENKEASRKRGGSGGERLSEQEENENSLRESKTDDPNFRKCFDLILHSNKLNINYCLTDKNGAKLEGKTPLYFAIKYQSRGVIFSILRRGASLVYLSPWEVFLDAKTLNEYLDESVKPHFSKPLTKIHISALLPSEKDEEEPETKFLRYLGRNPDLHSVLHHPVIQILLSLKWKTVRTFYDVNLIVFLMFSITLTLYIILSISGKKTEDGANKEDEFRDLTPILICKALIIISYIGLIFRELLQVYIFRKEYFTNYENYIEIGILNMAAYILYLDPGDKNMFNQLAAILILLTATESLLLIGRQSPLLFISINVLKTVSQTLIKWLFPYLIIILAFASAFYLLFQNPEGGKSTNSTQTAPDKKKNDDNAFKDPYDSFIRTLVMLTGEFEVGNLDFNTYRFTSSVVFIAYVFFMNTVLFGVCSALAFGETQIIMKNAEVRKEIYRIEHIAYWESVLRRNKTIQNFLKIEKLFQKNFLIVELKEGSRKVYILNNPDPYKNMKNYLPYCMHGIIELICRDDLPYIIYLEKQFVDNIAQLINDQREARKKQFKYWDSKGQEDFQTSGRFYKDKKKRKNKKINN